MSKTVLMLTTGQSDVQLVLPNEAGEPFRTDLRVRGLRLGELHEQFHEKARNKRWKLVDTPLAKPTKPYELPEGLVSLCTPKFDAVMTYFGAEMPDQVLILETTRRLSEGQRGLEREEQQHLEKIKNDPHQTGVILENRIKQWEKKTSRPIKVMRRAYLTGIEHLEDRDVPMDAVVRSVVVERLRDAIREAVKSAERVVVAPSGGMPEIKNLVREMARLYAPHSKLECLEVEDGGFDQKPDQAICRERIDPVEVVRAQRQALVLLEKGNFLGAYAVVRAYEDRQPEWVRVLRWLKQFQAMQPLDSACNLQSLAKIRPAARAAMRVELALRMRDLPRAILGTVAFFEASFHQVLARYIQAHPKQAPWFKWTMSQVARRPDCLVFREGEGRLKDYFRLNTNEASLKEATRLLFKDTPLVALEAATSDEVRYLRNDIAHGEPTPDSLKEAESLMEKRGLWSPADESGRHHFLCQRVVESTLKWLGEKAPQSLVSDLIKEARERLLAEG